MPVVLNDGRRILLGILEDITESLENKRQIAAYQSHLEALVEQRTKALRQLASTDTLTGLSNRAHFFAILEERISAENPGAFSLIYLDLDRFKLVNDTYGHDFGDRILQIIGERLRGKSGELIHVARIGGDEFAILLNVHVGSPRVDETCGDLVRLLNERIELDGRVFHVEGAMGICGFPDDASTPRQMLQHADMAMYHAKSLGRNRYQFFTDELNQKTQLRANMESELRQALVTGEGFRMAYQPKIGCSSEGLVGLEALVRWIHPVRGFVPPDQFIGVAEDALLIDRLGDWIVNAVLKQVAAWRGGPLANIPVAINISPLQLRSCAGWSMQAGVRVPGSTVRQPPCNSCAKWVNGWSIFTVNTPISPFCGPTHSASCWITMPVRNRCWRQSAWPGVSGVIWPNHCARRARVRHPCSGNVNNWNGKSPNSMRWLLFSRSPFSQPSLVILSGAIPCRFSMQVISRVSRS